VYRHNGKLSVKPGVHLPRGFPTRGPTGEGTKRKLNLPLVNPERRVRLPRREELKVVDPHTGKPLPRTY
jgi:hypothetical protein